MLTNIENRLEELFEQIEVMPPDRVEMAEKVRWEKFITKSSKQQQAAFKSKHHSVKRYEILHGSNFAPCFSSDERLIFRWCLDTGFVSYNFCNQVSMSTIDKIE